LKALPTTTFTCPPSADDFVVIAMRANPKPMNALGNRQAECSVVQADSDTVKPAIGYGFEVQ
jgi:hypothetical protein